jgi:hypothetical protein
MTATASHQSYDTDIIARLLEGTITACVANDIYDAWQAGWRPATPRQRIIIQRSLRLGALLPATAARAPHACRYCGGNAHSHDHCPQCGAPKGAA